MNDRHEPRGIFVDRLEAQIGAEVRKRNREMSGRAWTPRSRFVFGAATAAVVLVSMIIGGAAVAVAYQSQSNEQRAMLVDTYSRKLQIARERMELAAKMLRDMQVRVQIGVVTSIDVLESQLKIKDAEAQVQTLSLQIEEVKVTGQEPAISVSAPLAAGKDFLSERWRVDLGLSKAILELEQARLQNVQRRVDVGAADALDAQASRARLVELEAAIENIERKLETRQRFLAHAIDATQANLRVLEAEARRSLTALKAQIELAMKATEVVAQKYKVGAAQQVELYQAQLHVQELQADIAKAELELALVLKQLKGK